MVLAMVEFEMERDRYLYLEDIADAWDKLMIEVLKAICISQVV